MKAWNACVYNVVFSLLLLCHLYLAMQCCVTLFPWCGVSALMTLARLLIFMPNFIIGKQLTSSASTRIFTACVSCTNLPQIDHFVGCTTQNWHEINTFQSWEPSGTFINRFKLWKYWQHIFLAFISIDLNEKFMFLLHINFAKMRVATHFSVLASDEDES